MTHSRSIAARALPWVAIVVSACGHPAPPPAPGPVNTLVRRDYDQVCQVDWRQGPLLNISEIFDTAGLGAELEHIHAPPLSPDSRSGRRRWRSLDFITRYRRDGHPGATGVWQTTLDSASTLRVRDVLRERIRRIPSLLEATGLRTVVVFTPSPTVSTASPVVCLPHMRHARNQRPVGLPRNVSTWLEPSYFRPGRWRRSIDPTATVRIHLDADGTVTAVDSLDGDSTSVERTRAIVAALRFYPALQNGEGRAVEFVQSFAFLSDEKPGGS